MLLTLWVITTVTFAMAKAIPGGPFTREKALPPAIEANIEERYHLNDPLWKQYLDYFKNLLQGDLGPSYTQQGRTVNDIIREGFPVTATLGLLAVAIALGVGVPAGIISALRQYKWQDYIAMILATIGVSVPSFIMATLLMYVLAFQLRWLPPAMWGTPQQAIMPALSLAGFPAAFFARLVRSSMLDVMGQDYIRTARAKGLSERVVIYRHAIKNALIPAVTYLGPLLAGILTGSFVVEQIFAIPGIGRSLVQGIYNRDYTVILGMTVFYSVLLVVMNLAVDLVYVLIDPRIKLADRKG